METRLELRERPREETWRAPPDPLSAQRTRNRSGRPCRDAIADGQETWPCDKCGTKLHAECFHDNRLACTVLGCNGRAVTPEGYGRTDRDGDPRFTAEARQERERLRQARRERGLPPLARPVRPPPAKPLASRLQFAGPAVESRGARFLLSFRRSIGAIVIIGAPLAAWSCDVHNETHFLAPALALSGAWLVVLAVGEGLDRTRRKP